MLGLSKMKFFTRLLEKSQSEPEVEEEGSRFVISVTDLLEKLLDYRWAYTLSHSHTHAHTLTHTHSHTHTHTHTHTPSSSSS